ncbi:hypothetical protein PNQ92_11175 [Halobacterium salinarum]|uniref:hypothetical protein n=1 Tax=Halobacterium salinarum TaxID=2242 RepID=UPI002552C9EE|nr:hypothetical protein [Halobacterium salinarum]MDL0125967.1 hypothetical protein [Halobacterium salinarum]
MINGRNAWLLAGTRRVHAGGGRAVRSLFRADGEPPVMSAGERLPGAPAREERIVVHVDMDCFPMPVGSV